MKAEKINLLIAGTLRGGGIGVVPTDTIYGIVGSALNKKTIRKIYRLRKRNPKKPMIILIGSMNDLKLFGIHASPTLKKILSDVWPGAVSVVLPIGARAGGSAKKFAYLHRGTRTLAFRLPKPEWLRALLRKTGPLVAPSANIEGKRPARTMKEAKRYFGDKIQCYVDVGRRDAKPSTLVTVRKNKLHVLRMGAASVGLL